jgi:hypothetical protein
MEITIHGEGTVVVRFINKKGQTLLEERLAVSGSSTVQAKRIVPLALETTKGEVPVAPVLVQQSHDGQRVMFEGKDPAAWTRERCRKIGCPRSVVDGAGRGSAPALTRGQIGAFLSDGPDMSRLSDEANRK